MSDLKAIAEQVLAARNNGGVFYHLDTGLNMVVGETAQMVGLAVKHIEGPPPHITGKYELTTCLENAEALARAYLALLEKNTVLEEAVK